MASDETPGRPTPTLSVVVPTYQESANVPILFERVKAALEGLPWEMIVVDDDSPDGTSNVAFTLAAEDRRLRCLRRVNRSGLAGAVIEGWMSSSADFVAVIDGDLQHDETILREMYRALAKGSANLAIGTRIREADRGSLSPARQALSDMGAWFFRRIAGTAIADPMSGFFMLRREIASRLAPRLSPDGFKILVDVILSAGGDLKIVEVPYRFRKRTAGESKLTPLVGIDFLGLVVHHATAGALPTRFVLFAMIGASGLVVHIVTLSAVLHWFGALSFDSGQLIATVVAMASNFILNNEITYSSYRYRGFGLIEGFAAFALGCSVGAIANIDVASWLFNASETWWVAGLAGALLSVVWNYAVSTNSFGDRAGADKNCRAASRLAIRARVWLHSVPFTKSQEELRWRPPSPTPWSSSALPAISPSSRSFRLCWDSWPTKASTSPSSASPRPVGRSSNCGRAPRTASNSTAAATTPDSPSCRGSCDTSTGTTTIRGPSLI